MTETVDIAHTADADSSVVASESVTRKRHQKKWNVLAIAAFLAALVGSPLAMIFGYIAVGQTRRSDQRGAGLAWTAVGLGWVWTVAFIALISALATVWWNNPIWP